MHILSEEEIEQLALDILRNKIHYDEILHVQIKGYLPKKHLLSHIHFQL